MFSFFKKNEKRRLQALSLVLSFSFLLVPIIARAFLDCPSEGHKGKEHHSHHYKSPVEHHAPVVPSGHSFHEHSEKMADTPEGHSHSGRDPGACCRAPFPSYFILTALPTLGSGKIESHPDLTFIFFIPHEASLVSFLGTYTHYGTGPPSSLQGFSLFLQTIKILS